MLDLVAVAWRIAKRRNDLEGLVRVEQEAARIAREKARFQKQRADRADARLATYEAAMEGARVHLLNGREDLAYAALTAALAPEKDIPNAEPTNTNTDPH